MLQEVGFFAEWEIQKVGLFFSGLRVGRDTELLSQLLSSNLQRVSDGTERF